MTANRGPKFGLRSMGRALSHRNFRLFFGGQGLSLIGTWMTRVATSWLVYLVAPQREMVPVLLGVVGFAGQIPAFFLSPLAGVLVDRWNRRRLLLVTQFLAMVQSFLLAVVAATAQTPTAVIWEVIILGAFQGVINSFDMPGRQAFLVEMVEEREDLANAIALNSSLVNGARLIGPSIAGLLMCLERGGLLVFHDRWLQLPGRHCVAVADARGVSPCSRRAGAALARLQGRAKLRVWFLTHPEPAPDHGAG
jgi:MFS family permease